jgi:septum formation topological specificity factor MinE
MLQTSTKHCRHAVVLTALLFLSAGRASAIPISDYQQNLKKTITTLEALFEMEADPPDDYQQGLDLAIESIRSVLPQSQTIETRDVSYNVDNSWLHKALDQVADPSADDHFEKLDLMIEHLQALESRIAEREAMPQRAESKEQAKARLESILARPEYIRGAKGPNALTRLIQDFMKWLQKFFPQRTPMEPQGASRLNSVMQVVVIILALLVLLYVARLLFKRFKGSGTIKTRKKRQPRIVLGERLEPDQTATDLLSEAEALARNGDLRAAIRKGYIALLVELGDRKLISLAQHKTNRDYLNSLRSAPHLHSKMRGLTASFERHWYGFDEATPNDWQDFRAGYLAALQTETT